MDREYWQEEVKKLGREPLIKIIADIRDSQDRIAGRLDAIEDRHHTLNQTVVDLHRAFPNGDINGHLRYHETMILMLEERRRLRQAIQEKTISGLVWAGLVVVGFAVWHEIQGLLGR